MNLSMIFEPLRMMYLKEIQLSINRYNYQGSKYFDLVRVFRKFYNNYLQYCIMFYIILRVFSFIYRVQTDDETFFVYDLTSEILYFHANKIYDVYLLSCVGIFLSCLSYLHYVVFHTHLAGYSYTVGSCFIDNHYDFVNHNPNLIKILWSWERFCHCPWATSKNYLNMLSKLWFYESGNFPVQVVFKHPIEVFSYMTTRIRIRIWMLTGIIGEVSLFTGMVLMGTIFGGVFYVFFVMNPLGYSWWQLCCIGLDLLFCLYTFYHLARTAFVICWTAMVVMFILSMIVQDLHQKISNKHRSNFQLVISLVHFYQQYRSVLKILLGIDRYIASTVLSIGLMSHIPMNVISFSWLFFKTDAHPWHRVMFGAIALTQFIFANLVLLPLSSASKRMHEPGNVIGRLQNKIDNRFPKVKLIHMLYYELIKSKHKLAFHVGPCKITRSSLFEGLGLYIYSYLFVLSYIYSK